jgi:hypothetical protein
MRTFSLLLPAALALPVFIMIPAASTKAPAHRRCFLLFDNDKTPFLPYGHFLPFSQRPYYIIIFHKKKE